MPAKAPVSCRAPKVSRRKGLVQAAALEDRATAALTARRAEEASPSQGPSRRAHDRGTRRAEAAARSTATGRMVSSERPAAATRGADDERQAEAAARAGRVAARTRGRSRVRDGAPPGRRAARRTPPRAASAIPAIAIIRLGASNAAPASRVHRQGRSGEHGAERDRGQRRRRRRAPGARAMVRLLVPTPARMLHVLDTRSGEARRYAHGRGLRGIRAAARAPGLASALGVPAPAADPRRVRRVAARGRAGARGYFTTRVVQRFDGRRWNLPSRIYSDLYVLRPGDAVTASRPAGQALAPLLPGRRRRARAARPLPTREGRVRDPHAAASATRGRLSRACASS